MKYCHHCGGPVAHHVPPGDDKLRYCCIECDVIFYQNPNNVVGTLPTYQNKVLLCKRAIEPRLGKWTLPAGFMENAETTLGGAIRETAEEAGAVILPQDCSLYTLFNLPGINQVYLFFHTQLRSLDFHPGAESLEVALFDEVDIPWHEIAFPVVKVTLEQYFQDRKQQRFPVRMFDIGYNAERKFEAVLISHSPE